MITEEQFADLKAVVDETSAAVKELKQRSDDTPLDNAIKAIVERLDDLQASIDRIGDTVDSLGDEDDL